MIKVTLNNLVESINIFNKIVETELNGGLAFKIARIVREVEKEVKFFNEQRQKIIEEYVIRDEQGNYEMTEDGNFKVDPSRSDECIEQFNSLLSQVIEINAEKISASDLEKFTISTKELMKISDFIEE